MRFVVLPIIVSRDGKVPHQFAEEVVTRVREAAMAAEADDLRPRLGRPPKCAKSTESLIGEFIGEQCEVGAEKWCGVSDMWRSFSRYMCAKYGCMPLSRESFAIELSRLGFQYKRNRRVGPNQKQARTWEGVCVLNDLQAPAMPAAPAVRNEYEELRAQLTKTLQLRKERIA
ncbi:MAG TPA: hypothetical protein VHC90_09725 [Bryobacteraceae bacterium]|nr:hypothetical protein [Bryobacteraceae bacterium]